MQMLALIWGILAIIGMLIGFIPCLGWLNWINIPFAIVGLVVSIIAYTGAAPDKKGGAMGGIICCAIAMGLGLIRLVLGGGVI